MTNINKIIVTHINLSDNGYLPPLSMFDFHIFYDLENFIGVSLDSKNLRYKLEDSGFHKVYSVEDVQFAIIPSEIKSRVLEYIGFNLSVDDMLDLILDGKLTSDRRFYIETVLYYKTNQEGKKLQKYNLNVKNFDDLIMEFPQDFHSYRIIKDNEDFSESEIVLETYLTHNELIEKFNSYLVKIT